MSLPFQPKKHTKKDMTRWLLEFYDIDNGLTHMNFINQIQTTCNSKSSIN